MKIICNNEIETKILAEKIALKLMPNDILCLDGDLGAGKTTFTKYICQALDIESYVHSPSYSLVNEYEGKLDIDHFDVYRIYSLEELYDIGYEEYFNRPTLKIIEWAKKIEELIPSNSIWIYISLGENLNQRIFSFKGNLDKLDFLKKGLL